MVTTVGCVGLAYHYKKRLSANAQITPEKFHSEQAESIANVLQDEAFKQTPKTLYQYTTCPFCCKLKAFLDYHQIEYATVEVNPITKKQIKDHGFGKVPQLQIGSNGPIIVDSNEIVRILKPLVDPDSPEITDEEQQWKDWASTTLPRYMVINTNRTLKEANQGYDYAPNINGFSWSDKLLLKLFGGLIMYSVSKLVVKKKLQRLNDYDGGDERIALYNELDDWIEFGLNGKNFHGGESPSVADLDVYGVIQSVRFFPVYNDLKENSNPEYAAWLDRMDSLMPGHYFFTATSNTKE